MINMLSILVILMNVLIGQISARYEEAMMNASISYDIDRCILVAKCERTPFKNFLVSSFICYSSMSLKQLMPIFTRILPN